MIKVMNESSKYDYLMKSYKKGDLDDETALQGFIPYKGETFNVFIQFDSNSDKYPQLIGYFGDGAFDDYTSAPLKADDIENCDLSAYMNGYDIIDFEGMLRDNPKAFYIEDETAKDSDRPYVEVQVGMRWVEDEFNKECIKIEGNKCWIKETWLSIDSDKEHEQTDMYEITKGEYGDILVDPKYRNKWYGKLAVSSAINLDKFYPDYH